VPLSSSRLRLVSLLATGCVLLGGLLPGTASAADAARLQGVVRDHQDETPIGGATVQAVDGFGHVVASTKADSAGVYSVALPAGSYEVVVVGGAAGRRYAARARDVTVGGDSHLDFSISRPVVFTGTVRDGSGGPLPGVTVGLQDSGFPYMGAGSATTDAAGSFTITAASGVYTLTVSENLPDHGWLSASTAGMDLSADRARDLVFPVAATDTVVQGADGSAIAGASVTLGSDRTCENKCPAPFALFPGAATAIQWSSLGTTGADGHVVLPTLADANAVFTAGAAAPGLGQVRRPGVTIPAPAPLTAALCPTVTFSGILTGSDGNPVEGAVTLENGEYQSASQTEYSTTTGSFSVSVPPGRYRLHVDADVGTASVQDGRENRDPVPGAFVTVADFDLTADRTQNLTVPTAPYTVRLVDHDGNAVTGGWSVGCSGGTPTNCDVEASDATGTASVELSPGLTGTGVLRHDSFFFDGTAPLKIFPGSPPSLIGAVGTKVDGAVVVASDANGATLRLPAFATISGTAGDPRGPFGTTGPSSDVYVAMDADPSSDGGAQVWNGAYSISTRPGHHTISVGDGDGYDEDDEATATLPEFWQLTSDIDATGPTTVNFTVPDTRTGAVELVGPDGNRKTNGLYSVRGSTLAADVPMGGGRTGRGWVGVGGTADSDGFIPLQLFGASDLTGWYSSSVPVRFRLAPDERLVVADAAPLPAAVPGMPTGLHTSRGPDSINVAWQTPVDNGGGPILRWILAAGDGVSTTFGAMSDTTTTGTIFGLRPETTYTITVAGENARGVGPAATLQVTTTPADSTTPPSVDLGTGTDPADPTGTTATAPGSVKTGYWALSSDGHVYSFGDAPVLANGSAGAVDLEATPTGKGYWVLNHDGTVAPFGDAVKLGDVDTAKLANGEVPASLSATPSGKGYWVFTNRGRVLAFGDAQFLGDMSQTKLNGPVLGSVATPSGKGYYMVASDGGIFAFGDATFAGSMGGRNLNAPVQSLVPDADGRGYWLVAGDGGIFAFDAPFKGSMGGTRLNKPVVGMVRYGDGYLMVAADGGIFNFSSLPFSGSLGSKPPSSPVVAVAALP